jgi:hypothetical protein
MRKEPALADIAGHARRGISRRVSGHADNDPCVGVQRVPLLRVLC